jgi:hypothetical protein
LGIIPPVSDERFSRAVNYSLFGCSESKSARSLFSSLSRGRGLDHHPHELREPSATSPNVAMVDSGACVGRLQLRAAKYSPRQAALNRRSFVTFCSCSRAAALLKTARMPLPPHAWGSWAAKYSTSETASAVGLPPCRALFHTGDAPLPWLAG